MTWPHVPLPALRKVYWQIRILPRDRLEVAAQWAFAFREEPHTTGSLTRGHPFVGGTLYKDCSRSVALNTTKAGAQPRVSATYQVRRGHGCLFLRGTAKPQQNGEKRPPAFLQGSPSPVHKPRHSGHVCAGISPVGYPFRLSPPKAVELS